MDSDLMQQKTIYISVLIGSKSSFSLSWSDFVHFTWYFMKHSIT